ncbi:MAG: tyrosine-type recombinase/integrase [Holophagales bacterium]|nr:MAG: tyrosine-type recombinase/integrase [Holophagales bacterium]
MAPRPWGRRRALSHVRDSKTTLGRLGDRTLGWHVTLAPHSSREPIAGSVRATTSTICAQRTNQRAVREVGTANPASFHTLGQSLATHLLEAGYDISNVWELFGHRDVSTALIQTHVLDRGSPDVRKPGDGLNRCGSIRSYTPRLTSARQLPRLTASNPVIGLPAPRVALRPPALHGKKRHGRRPTQEAGWGRIQS